MTIVYSNALSPYHFRARHKIHHSPNRQRQTHFGVSAFSLCFYRLKRFFLLFPISLDAVGLQQHCKFPEQILILPHLRDGNAL